MTLLSYKNAVSSIAAGVIYPTLTPLPYTHCYPRIRSTSTTARIILVDHFEFESVRYNTSQDKLVTMSEGDTQPSKGPVVVSELILFLYMAQIRELEADQHTG